MPFYTFLCHSCGHKFEIMCSIAQKDSGTLSCPKCKANELDRYFEGFSVAVKGGEKCACPASGGACPHSSGCGCACQHGKN